MKSMRAGSLSLLAISLTIFVVPPAAVAQAPDSLVTVGSPSSPFPQNKQNEPGVAIDPAHPSVAVAGANDEIDLAPCAGASCPFTPGVGVSGVYFSFNGGTSWMQPTYQGYSARSGTAGVGPIGTVPNFYENGLASDGDPSLAFGPVPGQGGRFSYSNGSRLYYASLAANLATVRADQTFRGFEAIAVSHTDSPQAAAAGSAGAWSDPVIATASRQSSATFSDKESIAADNASSSRYFGNVYVCYTQFRSASATGGSAPIFITRSTNGGTSFERPQQLTAAFNNATQPGRQGCDVATDSRGTVYAVWEDTYRKHSVFEMSRSFDGGRTYEKPRVITEMTDVGAFDNVRSISFDGVAGARTGSFPSLEIANGAPTGMVGTQAAPDTVAIGWSDGAEGLNNEHALVRLSGDRGQTFGPATSVERSGDRPDFAFIGLSPDGKDLYTVYDGFLDPFRTDTNATRRFQGVVRHANISGTTMSPPTTLYQGAVGDARASSANALIDEFLGDYNTVAATSNGAIAVFNDARNAVVCPAINTYRQSIVDTGAGTAPAPATACPPGFGNIDIYSATIADPTP